MAVASEFLLGIDVGTQGVKGILVEADGNIFAQYYVEHGSYYPRPDWCEQDMWKNWWEDSVEVIRKLIQTDGVKPDRVKAVGVSGLYPALGPTDAEGNPIHRAIIYSDNRSVAEVEEVNAKCGLQLSTEELTPRLIWFLRNEPELSSQMKMFFDAHHYLIYKLCGEYVTDTVTTGLYGAIYESPTASWRADVCEMFDIPLEILPEVYPPAHIVGGVHRQASEATGLVFGTPVIAGLPDLLASLISVGTVYTYETAANYGTAGLVPVMKDNLLNAVQKPYPISERGLTPQDGYVFDYPAYCLTVADSTRWFRDEFAHVEMAAELDGSGPNAYVALSRLAEETPPGADGLLFLPYLLGQRSPVFNPWTTGVFFGLKNVHTRGYFYRAVLESFGYMIRHGFETFYPQGHPITRLVATGGGARSPVWRQVVSDITGLRQEYIPDADGPLGSAYVAGIAIGWFNNFDVLKNEWVKVQAVTEPNLAFKEIYDKYYSIYVNLHDALDEVYKEHHEIQSLLSK